MSSHEIAGVPDGVARQDFGDGHEHFAIAGIARHILLAVDVATIVADRRVAHPPPACLRYRWFVWIGHRRNPSIVFDVAVRQSAHRLKSLAVTSDLNV